MSYAKITLIGNLGRDPELRYTPSGQAVTNFNMATTEKWQGQDGQLQERTTWWKVSVFGKQAETVNQHLKKGSKVYVEGRMISDPKTGGPRTYEKQDKTIGTSFELTAQTIKFLDSRPQGQAQAQNTAEAEPEAEFPF